MILCPACGTRNEDKARFCSECGFEFIVPRGGEHDFTHGVMRYEPDRGDDDNETPLYLTSQAAEAFHGPSGTPALPVPSSGTAQSGAVSAAGVPAARGTHLSSAGKRTRKKNSHLAAIIVMSLIGILVILIIVGIAVLLGG